MTLDDLLEEAITKIVLRISTAEEIYFELAGKRLNEIYGLSNDQLKEYLFSAEYLADTSSDLRKVARELNKAGIANLKEIENLYSNITDTVYQEGTSIAVEKGNHLLPLEVFRETSNPMLEEIKNQYTVMSRSTTVNDTYKKTISQFVSRIAYDDEKLNAPTALRKAIKELSDQGISTIQYASGRTVRMDSAVRNALMTEYTQAVQQVQNKLADEVGFDAKEISFHNFPAKDHETLGGCIFENAEFEKLQAGEEATDIDGNTHQTDRPIGMWGCRHIAHNFMLGVSERAYSREQIDRMQAENEVGIQWNGERISLYDGTQIQRRIETDLRYQKGKMQVLKSVAGADPAFAHDKAVTRDRIKALNAEYDKISSKLESHALRAKRERASVPKQG